MIKTTFYSLIICVGLLVAGTQSSLHALTLTVGDSNYVGLINDGIPASPSNEVGFINTLTTLAPGATVVTIGTEDYDRVGSTLAGPFDTATLTGADKWEDGRNTTTLADSYQYILGKYDASSAGSLVWYFGTGITGVITLPSTFSGQGISHLSVYNEIENGAVIPEPSTVALLGIGLAGLAGAEVRRRRKKKTVEKS